MREERLFFTKYQIGDFQHCIMVKNSDSTKVLQRWKGQRKKRKI